MSHSSADLSAGFAGLPPREPRPGFTARNPMLVVDDYPGAQRALDWLTWSAPDHAMRATFVHVLDSRHVYQNLGWGGLPLVQAWHEAQIAGERLLATLRTVAPDFVSVTTRLLVAQMSRARQILRAVDASPSCDVLVISMPMRSRFDSTARMCNYLLRRSPVPLLVPVTSGRREAGLARSL